MILCCEKAKIIQDNWHLLDPIAKIATIVIASLNVVLTIFIFFINFRKNNADKEQDRKLQLFKTFVLDHNLNEFYSFYTNLENTLLQLKMESLTDVDRQRIIDESESHFIKLSRNFIDSLLAIDKELYQKVLDQLDLFQEELNTSISDKGIVLSHQPKYDEIITNKMSRSKTSILTILYNYR